MPEEFLAQMLSCPSSSQCTIVGLNTKKTQPVQYQVLSFDPTSPGTLTPHPDTLGSGLSITSVQCLSASSCVAVGTNGRLSEGSDGDTLALVFDPKSPGTARSFRIGSGPPFGVSCPTTSQCTTLIPDPDFRKPSSEVTFDPSSGAVRPATVLPLRPSWIDCPSTSQCTATSQLGFVTFVPRSHVVSSSDRELMQGQYRRGALSCPSLTQCTAVGTRGSDGVSPQASTAVTFEPTTGQPNSAGVWTFPTGGNVVAVDCPATSECVAVDNVTHRAETFDPTTGAINEAGRVASLPRRPGLVSCPTSTQCTTVGAIKPPKVRAGGQTTWDPTTGRIVSNTQITLDRSAELVPTGSQASLGRLARTGVYPLEITFASAGKHQIDWLYGSKRLKVASGAKSLKRNATTIVRIRLTSKGRALFAKSRRIKLTVVDTFTPEDGDKVVTRRTITLTR